MSTPMQGLADYLRKASDRSSNPVETGMLDCWASEVEDASKAAAAPGVEAQGVPHELDFGRDNDGELLIDWSPAKGRMVTLSLRDDGRLSYAVMWNGERIYGAAQMPASAPQGQRQPLNEEQLARIWIRTADAPSSSRSAIAFARAIEAAHDIGEKKP